MIFEDALPLSPQDGEEGIFSPTACWPSRICTPRFVLNLIDLQVSHLLNTADFDPEEDVAVQSSNEGSDSQESSDERLGTEHYVEVGYVIALEIP